VEWGFWAKVLENEGPVSKRVEKHGFFDKKQNDSRRKIPEKWILPVSAPTGKLWGGQKAIFSILPPIIRKWGVEMTRFWRFWRFWPFLDDFGWFCARKNPKNSRKPEKNTKNTPKHPLFSKSGQKTFIKTEVNRRKSSILGAEKNNSWAVLYLLKSSKRG